ncbi:hypothetical protein CANINC_001909 [Pichia inconspicua]|uniref:Uncharacterized protein n=1 Tax=Pichia inconspicua TaxID=52247 RepID=A0A4T0X444_9ASCO|nr:hypothetical protein CANINC_001909 [[Candida] inconspicua]
MLNKLKTILVVLIFAFTRVVTANTEVAVIDGWCDPSVSKCFNSSIWNTEFTAVLSPSSNDIFHVHLPSLPYNMQFLTRVCWSAAAGASISIGDLHLEGEQLSLQVEIQHEGVTVEKPPSGSIVEVVVLVAVEAIHIVPVKTAQLGVYATVVGVVAAFVAWHVL